MKSNSSVLFTSMSLVVVLAIAAIAGLLTFGLGSEALKGINQLDIQPPKSKTTKAAAGQNQPTPFLKEAEVINQVKTRIRGQIKAGKAKPPK